jgi:FdhD protein
VETPKDRKAYVRVPSLEANPQSASKVTRSVVREVPVALTYNGVAHVVMFMSPIDIEDFVTGFSLSEGIIETADELLDLEVRDVATGMLANAEISPENFAKVSNRPRNLPGQSGCGICGVVELEQAIRPLPSLRGQAKISRTAIFGALNEIRARQELNAQTGAAHAAAFVDQKGEIIAIREDVGRHNALDKLIGHLARTGVPFDSGFVLMTSRCSVELVQKSITCGLPALVTISAPTDLALNVAKEAGLALVCLARLDSILIYNDPMGILADV